MNAGVSVSRVGGNAQVKAMKKIAGRLRLDLAQYRELAAFSQFGSELDKDTKDKLDQGARVVEILKQDQYSPMPVEEQIMSIFAVTNGYLMNISIENIERFEKEFLEFMANEHSNVGETLKNTGNLDGETEQKLRAAIEAFLKTFV